jgi:hypothetical protein
MIRQGATKRNGPKFRLTTTVPPSSIGAVSGVTVSPAP